MLEVPKKCASELAVPEAQWPILGFQFPKAEFLARNRGVCCGGVNDNILTKQQENSLFVAHWTDWVTAVVGSHHLEKVLRSRHGVDTPTVSFWAIDFFREKSNPWVVIHLDHTVKNIILAVWGVMQRQ
jgi:hypothetical protein